MSELGRHHQRAAPAVVDVVEPRPSRQQQLGGLDPIGVGHVVGVTGGPHQRRQAVAVTGIGVDASPEQALGNAGAAALGATADRPGELTLAPRSISSATALGRLASMARKSGVAPERSRNSMSAPCSSSSLATSGSVALTA